MPYNSFFSTASMALAPGIPRLHSLCFPIAAAGITVGGVPHLTIGRVSLVDVVGLALVRCQTVATTTHGCHTPDDKDNGEETEDQDVKHDPLDHGRLEMSCPDSFCSCLAHPVVRCNQANTVRTPSPVSAQSSQAA